MSNNINVKVTAKAYERGHVKTKLSQFENDLELLTVEDLLTQIDSLKDWVRAYTAQTGTTTGSISGGDISFQDNDVEVGHSVYGGDIAEIIT